MKKYRRVIIFSLILALLLASCSKKPAPDSNTQDTAEETSDQTTYNWMISHTLPETAPIHMAVVKFTEFVKEKSDGKINIEVFPNSMLGSDEDILKQMGAGALEMASMGAPSLANFVPQLQVFNIPYLFESDDHFFKALDGGLINELNPYTEDAGYTILSYFYGGARSIYTSEKPVRSIEDMKGLRIRVQDNPVQTEMMSLFGAEPVPLPFPDIPLALSMDAVDGAENVPAVLSSGGHGEMIKYYSFTEHTNIPDFIIISTAIWNELTPEYKQILKNAAEEATVFEIETAKADYKDAIATSEEKFGIEFITVDKEPFINAVKPLHDEAMENEDYGDLFKSIKDMKF